MLLMMLGQSYLTCLMMLVGNSDGGEQKAIAWLYGVGSKRCCSIYARNSIRLVGRGCGGIQTCPRHPLSHRIIYWQIPLLPCCRQEQDTATWCFMHAYCVVKTWTYFVLYFLQIVCVGFHSWNVHCFMVWWYRKYEEISPPHVEDFCYMTDNTYTMEEVSVYFFLFFCFALFTFLVPVLPSIFSLLSFSFLLKKR